MGVVARVDRKEALKFVPKLIALLEDNGLAVFLEPKLAERIRKSRLLYLSKKCMRPRITIIKSEYESAFVRFGDFFYRRLKGRLLFSRGESF